MMLPYLSEELAHLIQRVSKFPGLGARSSRRIVLHLLRHKEELLAPLIQSLSMLHEIVQPCHVCGYLDERSPCFFCSSGQRNPQVLCIVADTGDVWAIERMGVFKGQYHILGGLLSVLDNCGPENLRLDSLWPRLQGVREVIMALDSNVSGQSTLYYLSEQIALHAGHIKISSLAKGMPMGSELEYLDQGTLMSAFLERRAVQDVAPVIDEEGVELSLPLRIQAG